ncbi:MAG: hypothetical protein H6850_00895 [Alphaproteobacteria bacterium]|nr:MAG: hypothetical protein H6850_00895 [Alphaproteobacteria bacterium]
MLATQHSTDTENSSAFAEIDTLLQKGHRCSFEFIVGLPKATPYVSVTELLRDNWEIMQDLKSRKWSDAVLKISQAPISKNKEDRRKILHFVRMCHLHGSSAQNLQTAKILESAATHEKRKVRIMEQMQVLCRSERVFMHDKLPLSVKIEGSFGFNVLSKFIALMALAATDWKKELSALSAVFYFMSLVYEEYLMFGLIGKKAHPKLSDTRSNENLERTADFLSTLAQTQPENESEFDLAIFYKALNYKIHTSDDAVDHSLEKWYIMFKTQQV